VGNARERFGEDALRIMRAVRFSAQLGYTIEQETCEAIRELAPTLEAISAERIRVELEKLLLSPHPDYLRQAYEMGITGVILPEFDTCMETPQNHPHHMYAVGEHILHSLDKVEPDKVLRLTMLFHDIGKPATLTADEEGINHFYEHHVVGEKMTRDILRRLRYDNDTINKVCKLVLYHDYGNSVEPDMRLVRRAIHRVGEEMFPLLFPVKRADVLAQSDYMRREKLDNVDDWERVYEEVTALKQCVSLKDLAISGKDLIEEGYKPGPELGQILNELLMLVLENPQCNTREYLLQELQLR
jgi:tRNA nucleotidyltransferase (CCA-adding enzyme)